MEKNCSNLTLNHMHMYSEMSHYVNGSYTQVSMQRFDYKYYLEIATIPPKVRL